MRVRLRENAVDRWRPQAPVRVYHSPVDEEVPYGDALVSVERLRRRGATITVRTLSRIRSRQQLDSGAAAGGAMVPRHRVGVVNSIETESNDARASGRWEGRMHDGHLRGADDWRSRIVGVDQLLPLLDGRLAALHQPRQRGQHAAAAGRARGGRSASCPTTRACTAAPASSRGSAPPPTTRPTTSIARFVGADTGTNTVIFGKNTTEAINKLAFRYPLPPAAWCSRPRWSITRTICPGGTARRWCGRSVTPDGRLDEDGRRSALRPPRRAHRASDRERRIERDWLRPAHPPSGAEGARGGREDSRRRGAARAAPAHRHAPDDDPEHLDFVALSAHKMYAPFGTGALVGRRDIFLRGAPEYRGGGTVDLVTPTDVVTGPACRIATKRAVPTSLARWRWALRRRR